MNDNLLLRLVQRNGVEDVLMDKIQRRLDAFRELMMNIVEFHEVLKEQNQSHMAQELNNQQLLQKVLQSLENTYDLANEETGKIGMVSEKNVFSAYSSSMYIFKDFLSARYYENCTNLREITELFYQNIQKVQKQFLVRRLQLQQLQDFNFSETLRFKTMFDQEMCYCFDNECFDLQDSRKLPLIYQYFAPEQQKLNTNLICAFALAGYVGLLRYLDFYSNFVIKSGQRNPQFTVCAGLGELIKHVPNTVDVESIALYQQIFLVILQEKIKGLFDIQTVYNTVNRALAKHQRFNIYHLLGNNDIVSQVQTEITEQIRRERLQVPFYSVNNEFLGDGILELQPCACRGRHYEAVCQVFSGAKREAKCYSCEYGAGAINICDYNGLVVGYIELCASHHTSDNV